MANKNFFKEQMDAILTKPLNSFSAFNQTSKLLEVISYLILTLLTL